LRQAAVAKAASKEETMTQTRKHLDAGYRLSRESGVIDVWWPYQPQVGRYTIKIGSEQTDGRLSQLLCTDRRGGAAPLHIHRREDETFHVIAGEISFFVADRRIEATAGDFVFAPKGVPHAFVVESDCAEYLASFSPAGAEQFFAEVAPHVVPGESPPPPSEPDPEEFVRIAASYGIEIVGPPPTPPVKELTTLQASRDGSDGTRTRDLRRDRPVLALPV
jgi:quercetin dioxygenase-like cupin family protein